MIYQLPLRLRTPKQAKSKCKSISGKFRLDPATKFCLSPFALSSLRLIHSNYLVCFISTQIDYKSAQNLFFV
jgi:hypothetical protein